MKTIKDCKWTVRIVEGMNCYWWEAATNSLLSDDFSGVIRGCAYQYEKVVLRSWEKFAKLNDIKKWKYE